ncbi:MAG TPA: RNA 2',3'-cyclic phosphodiesterase [Elusimicrobiales bacterium]|nr:RNA 2',3'-cyclic phosphodiesterase [Elusimicrobiales bacterium]
MRLFIASRVSEGVLAGIERFLEPLRPSFGDSVKWVPARDMHLTWVFLGEITEAGAIPAIRARLTAAAAASGRVAAELGGIGGFPSLDRPRVLWLGFGAGADKLSELARRLRDGLEKDGYRPDGEFVPHITLARVKARPPAGALAALSGAAAEFAGTKEAFCSLDLMESRLSAAGASHRLLYSSVLA